MPETKKRKKNYYITSNKKSRYSEELKPGLQGYVITCSDLRYRKDTLMEAYRILNEYADIKYGPEILTRNNDDGDDGDEVNLEDALQKEVSDIKKSNAKGAPRRFQGVSTKAKSVIFIKANIEDPASLLNDIYLDLMSSQIKKTKFCLRFVPVICTCYAKTENIIKFAKQCVEPVFVEQPNFEIIRFCIVWKTRCNFTIKRDEVLPPILDYIFSKVEHVTDYKDPELVVNIDVIGNVCCIGLMRNYAKFKKYNMDLILETTKSASEEEKESEKTDDIETGNGGNEMNECENTEDEKEKLVEISNDIAPEASIECNSKHQDIVVDGTPVAKDACTEEEEKDIVVDGTPVDKDVCTGEEKKDVVVDGTPVDNDVCTGEKEKYIVVDGTPVDEDACTEEEEKEEIKCGRPDDSLASGNCEDTGTTT